jgi:inositol hexakisphosphate/diphosphoinositol-pentakisphosphate kinase
MLFQVVRETMELMRYHRDLLVSNWETMDVDAIQPRWYAIARL